MNEPTEPTDLSEKTPRVPDAEAGVSKPLETARMELDALRAMVPETPQPPRDHPPTPDKVNTP